MYGNGSSQGEGKEGKIGHQLGPHVVEGGNVFGVCYIFASFNDSFVHVSSLSGKEIICCVTRGMKDVTQRCKELGTTGLHTKLWAAGGNRTKTPGP
ncbi:unnamed protein product [Nyctereutes procyonoides]|uniref:(raccoon dog) hypothetical protein n=1 Tax=Nyctereutes procyonoides TaxID=34880 RepID=A0A811ZS68_NYCPR|nr:unnamed protein product [Nyctereutes procyonoides]